MHCKEILLRDEQGQVVLQCRRVRMQEFSDASEVLTGPSGMADGLTDLANAPRAPFSPAEDASKRRMT